MNRMLVILALLLAPLALHAQSATVKSADGRSSWSVKIDAGKVEAAIGGGEKYVGTSEGDKRRYRRGSDNAAFAEVKSSENGFKLRTPDAKLIWKIKFDAEKIKISDNEENANAFELKLKDEKTKVVDPSGKELGEVKFQADKGKVKVRDAADAERFSAEATQPSAAYGVLLLSTIPEPQRLIIFAEILASKR